MAEGGLGVSPAPVGTLPSTAVPGISPTLLPQTFTQAANSLTDTPLPSPTSTFTLPRRPLNCPPPAGWVAVVVQWYDTLPALAQTHNVSPEAIRQANCLVSDQRCLASFLYLPPLPYRHADSVRRAAPAGSTTSFSRGYALFHQPEVPRERGRFAAGQLSGQFHVHSGGKILKVPNVPTSTPPHSPAPSATFIVIREETFTPTPTDTPTLTLPPATTEAPSATAEPPTSTPAPTATP